MKIKTSAVLMLPSLTVLAASLQAADVAPSWVEYPQATTTPASTTTHVVAAPTVTTPATAVETAPTPVVAEASQATGASQGAAVVAPAAPLAATPAAAASPAEPGATGPARMLTTLTPRLYAFDYFKGVGETLPHYLERYDYREGLDGDTRSGTYADLDVEMSYRDQDRELFALERRGFGQHNHRGEARFDDDEMTLSGSYSHYRSSTGGLDYLYSPAQVPGAGTAPYPGTNPPDYYAGNLPFTDQTGTTDYHIDRTTYAAGFKMKPALLGGVAVALDYEGYKREGNQLATTIVMQGGGPPPTIDSWRGSSLQIDERMNRVGVSLAASPKGMFEIAYEGAIEKFTNGAPDLTRNDIMGTAGSTRQDLSPFYYVPDTTLISHNLRLTKPVGERAVIAAGLGYSNLQDDSTPERFTSFGDAWEGEISTTSAYLTANANVSPALSVEGHVKYHDRGNDSSFPVQHVIAPSGANARMAGPRIDSVESLQYGLSADWRPGVMGSTLTLGWQRLDRQRDLTYGAYSEAIPANRIFYREDTESDELYLKWTARPAPGWSLRLAPSYTWADQTGLVTEPEEAVKVKTMLSYTSPKGWLLSGFYDYRNNKNNDLYVTGDLTGTGTQYTQDVDHTFHTAGVTLNVLPRENVNTALSLYWMQNDLANYFLTTDVVRQQAEAVVTYLNNGLSSYKVDSYVFNLGTDWQASEKLKLNVSYTFSMNKGDTASGTVLSALQAATGTVDSLVDNTLHSLSVGADYSLSSAMKLRANYIYDRYDDDAYSLLSGGVHTLVIGLSVAM